jgi:hypothetical protein
MPISIRSTTVEPIRPVLHLLRSTATQKTWHVEYPERPDPETPNKGADRLGEARPQREPNPQLGQVWALARTPDQDETGLSQAEMIYLLPTYQSRLDD